MNDPLPAAVRRPARLAAAVALIVFGLLLTGGAPWTLFERGPFTADFYDAQAHALLGGHLDVPAGVVGIEGFLHDGRMQLYYGLVPALLRLPIALLTHGLDGRLTGVSMLVALWVALWATARLAWRARPTGVDDAVAGRVCAGLVLLVGLASPLLFLSSRAIVYHETELWGTAAALVALELLLRWWAAPSHRALACASAAAAVAMNTRASVGGGAVAALALVGLLALWRRRVQRRAVLALGAAVLVPVVLYGAVGLARFDSPFAVPFREQVISSFDARRQATLGATGDTLFGLEQGPTALLNYVRPDGIRLQRLFPFVTFRESTAYLGSPVFDVTDRTASIPVVAPTLLVLAGAGLVVAVRRRREEWVAAAVGTAAGIVPTVTIAFIANRYLADFTPLLVALGAVGVWEVVGRRRLVRLGWAVSALACLVSMALTIQAQRLFIFPDPTVRRDFVAFQLRVDSWWHGDGPAPDVRAASGDPGPVGPRGEMVVVDDCAALYWSDGQFWRSLELGADHGFTVFHTTSPTSQTLFSGAGWRVFVTPTGDARYETAGRTVDGAHVPAGVDLDVVVDAPNHLLQVRAGDHDVLTAVNVDLAGRVAAGSDTTLTPNPTPLCDALRARFGATRAP